MVAVSGGRIVGASTPNGAQGWWFEAWHSTVEDWTRYEVPASECPRLTPEFLAAEADTMHPWAFASEYECRFMSAGLAAWFDPSEFVVDQDMAAWT